MGNRVKLLGAVLILLSGFLLGWSRARELQKRQESLLDLKQMIGAFRVGISFSAQPVAALISQNRDSRFCRLAAESPEYLTAPKEALKKAGERLLKNKKDLALYSAFLEGLGSSDTQGQLEHLELYGNLIDANLLQAGENRDSKSKLYVCLGIFGGISLTLVLW